MKRIGNLVAFSSVVAMCGGLLPVYAVMPSGAANTAAAKTAYVKAQSGVPNTQKIVSGQIILKIKENAAAKASALSFASTAAGSDARLSATMSTFVSFKKKHKVRLTEHLFVRGAEERLLTGADMITDQSAHVNKVKTLFASRTKRASGKIATPRLDNIYRITLIDRSADVRAACSELSNDTTVEYAIPNEIYTVQYVPNDPLYTGQWAHQVTSAELAWDTERGQAGIVVAIVDCGIDYTHEDIAANLLGSCSGGCQPNMGSDFVDIDTAAYISGGYHTVPGEDYTTPDNNPMDFNGHGTHCAGIAAAVADNAKGVSGVAPMVKLMPVRSGFSIIMPGYGEVGSLESDDIANAIRYAADNGADVISMSFGGGFNLLQWDAIAYAASLGVVLVASAGNGNSADLSYPAAYDNVISVAATGQNDNRVYYSNYGSWVDVAAPGGDAKVDAMILSTVPRTGGALSSSTGYRALQGTSMAAPYIAGVAALVLSRDPSRSATMVESIIKRSVDMPKSNEYIGTGRINVLKAVRAASINASLTIDSPEAQILSVASTPVVGSVFASNGSPYKVFLGNGLYPTSWTLLSSGIAPVTHQTIATVNPASIANGEYTIKIVAYEAGDSLWAASRIFVDHSIYNNFPNLNIHYPGWSNNITLSDVDGDNAMEIFVGSNKGIFAFKGDGTWLPGFPCYFYGGIFTNAVTPSPAVADIDNDGVKEIVAIGMTSPDHWDSLYIYTSTGVIKPGFSLALGSDATALNPITLADLDNDGTMEIIFKRQNYFKNLDTLDRIMVLTSSGQPFQKWPFILDSLRGGHNWNYGQSLSHVLAFDIDNDGKKEIIASACKADNPGGPWQFLLSIYIFSYDGTLRSGYPIDLSGSNVINGVPPVMVDIDNDGIMEIGAVLSEGNMTSSTRYTYIKPDGASVSGWPVEVPYQLWSTNASLADIDRDGFIETIFGTYSDTNSHGWVSIYKSDGSVLSPWPIITDAPIQSPTIAADINSDGYPEVIAIDIKGKVYAWTYAGIMVSGFPKICTVPGYTIESVNSCPAVGDFNGDGKLELELSTQSGKFFVWDLSGNDNKLSLQWTMDLHDPMHNSDVQNNNGCQRIAIVTQPAGVTVDPPASATFSVAASGLSPSYQWQYAVSSGGTFSDITGATSSSYTTTATSASMNGYRYRCKVSNACPSEVISNEVTLTVLCQPIVITTQPVGVTLKATASAIFSVAASGFSPAYQWQFAISPNAGFSDIAGATSSSYTVSSTSGSMNGYLYRCKVSNSCPSSVMSNAAKLTVLTLQKIAGTAFGTSPPSAAGREYNKASDGNTATYFDYSQSSGGYTGIDLGSEAAKKIEKIRFYPRASYASRMNGGKFQGSNTASSGSYTDLYSIPSTPSTSWNEVAVTNATAWRYLRYYGPTNGYCDIAEMEFYAFMMPNAPPTIAVPAAAAPNPATATTTVLSVLGADDNGEANLIYAWAVTGMPPTAVTFSINGINAAKNTTATFTKAGSYTLQATLKDQGALIATSSVFINVNQTLASIIVSPATANVVASKTQQFAAVARDQFATDMATQPAFIWSVTGGGSIASDGLFTAGSTAGGPYSVMASSGGVNGTASVTVTKATVYQINCGGNASSPYTTDQYYSGGSTYSVTSAITTTGLTNPAPQAVYQTERFGTATYTLPNLTSAASYKVRLHFSENYWTAAGKRKFNVAINGTTVLSNYDIYAETGARYKAVVKEYTTTANASGQIVIKLTNGTDNAKIGGIEIIRQ